MIPELRVCLSFSLSLKLVTTYCRNFSLYVFRVEVSASILCDLVPPSTYHEGLGSWTSSTWPSLFGHMSLKSPRGLLIFSELGNFSQRRTICWASFLRTETPLLISVRSSSTDQLQTRRIFLTFSKFDSVPKRVSVPCDLV